MEPSRYPDLSTSVGAAVLVIGVSVALAWIIRNNREGKHLMEMAMSAAEEKMVSKETRPESVSEKDVTPQTPVKEPDLEEPEPDSEPEPEDAFEARLRRLMRD